MLITGYPKIHALGHKQLTELLDGPVVVQEKVDGSQFAFGLVGGELAIRSKGAPILPDFPPKLFAKAVATVQLLAHALPNGTVFRGEVLASRHHNIICYSRAPLGHIVLFDVDRGGQDYLEPRRVREWAHYLGLEAVPTFFEGVLPSTDRLTPLLANESFLGGSKIEGVVIKNYARFGPDDKPLMGKLVSAEFQERHKSNFARPDIVQHLIDELATEARWHKAIQHLRDAGELTNSPKDIGPLLKALSVDVREEEREYISEVLFKHFWGRIGRGITRGFPEWYKRRLAAILLSPSQ